MHVYVCLLSFTHSFMRTDMVGCGSFIICELIHGGIGSQTALLASKVSAWSSEWLQLLVSLTLSRWRQVCINISIVWEGCTWAWEHPLGAYSKVLMIDTVKLRLAGRCHFVRWRCKVQGMLIGKFVLNILRVLLGKRHVSYLVVHANCCQWLQMHICSSFLLLIVFSCRVLYAFSSKTSNKNRPNVTNKIKKPHSKLTLEVLFPSIRNFMETLLIVEVCACLNLWCTLVHTAYLLLTTCYALVSFSKSPTLLGFSPFRWLKNIVTTVEKCILFPFLHIQRSQMCRWLPFARRYLFLHPQNWVHEILLHDSHELYISPLNN